MFNAKSMTATLEKDLTGLACLKLLPGERIFLSKKNMKAQLRFRKSASVAHQ